MEPTKETEAEAGIGVKPVAGPVVQIDEGRISVSIITGLYVAKAYAQVVVRLVEQAIRVAALPERWREYFEEKLHRLSA